jgi:hypothetical protein
MARLPAIELVPGVVRIPTIGAANINSYPVVDEPTGTLIVCDTLFRHRRLRLCPRPICSDFRLDERSAQQPGELEYDRVAFAHGLEIARPGATTSTPTSRSSTACPGRRRTPSPRRWRGRRGGRPHRSTSPMCGRSGTAWRSSSPDPSWRRSAPGSRARSPRG